MISSGVSIEDIEKIMQNGEILIPIMAVVPTAVIANSDSPPELEVRFDLEGTLSSSCDTWTNWQIAFVHNQLFDKLQFPSRFCPGTALPPYLILSFAESK